MADEYVLISGLDEKTSPNTSDVLAICDSAGLNTNKITIPNLLGGRLNGIRAGNGEYKLFGSDSTGGIGQEVIVGSGLSYSGATLSGVDASTVAKGIAQFDSSDFAVSSGNVSIKTYSIENGDISTSAAIAHSKLANGSPTSVLGVTGGSNAALASIQATANNQVLRRTSSTALGFGTITPDYITGKTATVTSGSNLAVTDSDGYLNAMVKDTVYMQIFSKDDDVAQGTAVAYFYVPDSMAGKYVKRFSAGMGSAAATTGYTVTLASSGGTIYGQVAGVLNVTIPATNTTARAVLPDARTKLQINVNSGAGGKGLDVFFEVG